MPQGSITRHRLAQPATPQAQPLLAPNWFLGLVPRQYWNVEKSPFWYEGDFATTPLGNLGSSVGANATVSGSIQIQQDSHFLCVAGIALVTTTDNVTLVFGSGVATPSQKLVTITDLGPNQPLAQTPTVLESLFGTGQLPAVWSIPKLFEAGGGIGVTVQNLSGTAHAVRLSFMGVRIFHDRPMKG